MATDFYRILGVDRSASAKEISTAYRRLARQYHPDVSGGDPASEARFKEINAAHDVLGDEQKRVAYDKWGDQWEHAEQLEEMQRQRGGRAGFAGFGGPAGTRIEFGDASGFAGNIGGLGDLGDLFGGIFSGAPAGPSRGRDIEHPVAISLDEAFHGVARAIQSPRSDSGQGFSRLEVKIPAGAATGTRVKVPGKGRPGPADGPPGDLFLVVAVADDPRFERRGDDLRSEVGVPVHDAALGGEITVPTLTGQVALRIPQATANGRVFRLAGQGMPRLKRDGRGDLLVAVRLELPDPLDSEQLELFRRLRELEHRDA